MWLLTTNSIPYEHFTHPKLVQNNRTGQSCLGFTLLQWIGATLCAALVILPLMTVMALDAGAMGGSAGNETVLMPTFQLQPTIANANFTAHADVAVAAALSGGESIMPLAHLPSDGSGDGGHVDGVGGGGAGKVANVNVENTFSKLRLNAKAKLADVRVKHLHKERAKNQQQHQHQHQQKHQQHLQPQQQQHQSHSSRKAYQRKQHDQQHKPHHHQTKTKKKKMLHAISGGGGGGGGVGGGGIGEDKTTQLLEHTSASMHEQPIYGTWRTKARRPEPEQLSDAAAKAMQPPTGAAPQSAAGAAVIAFVQASSPQPQPPAPSAPVDSATATRTGRILTASSSSSSAVSSSSKVPTHMGDGNKQNANANPNAIGHGHGHGHGHENHNHNSVVVNDYRHHVYEPLPPQRSSSALNSPSRNGNGGTLAPSHEHNVPRPPRIVSRQPSLVVRRQYLETPLANYIARDEQKPKPFHFPYDGPLPEEFKKPDNERPDVVNNIQDVLQQLHLNGGAHKVPQLVMMPTGLHIAGSFKNLKSSGIMNFFRGKRNNNKAKQMQLAIPMPLPMHMQMLSGVHPAAAAPMYAALAPSPYQQRITMDQFYAFKPRSPSEVNLLAIHHQQQQQQQQQKAKRSKSKKHKNAIATTNLLLQHSNQLPFAAVLGFNATPSSAMNSNLKHVPFNVNLDIFPVLPPNKPFYAAAASTYDQMKMPMPPLPPSSVRPMPALRNPYSDYYGHAVAPSAAALIYESPHAYKPIKFPGPASHMGLQMPQASNVKVTFPDQASSFYQQQQQQQQQRAKLHFQPSEPLLHNRPASVAAVDCNYPPYGGSGASSSSAPKGNQLMVHLNVFPKQQRPQSAALTHPTNPFYGSAASVNRQTIYEEGPGHNFSPADPIYMAKSSSSAIPPATAVSTTSQPSAQQQQQHQQQQQQKITARSDNLSLMAFNEPSFEPITSKDYAEPQQGQTITLISNKLDNAHAAPSYNTETHAQHNYDYDVEPHDAFRFPVEDLIQFQVNDAL